MKGDFSRWRFDPTRHYAAVLEQQGRVGLDADGNEATAINDHLRTTTNRDVIGACGVPKHGGGFKISLLPSTGVGVTDLAISPGRIYVDGILCELEDGILYKSQLDYPDAPFAPVAGQTDLVYLDVWQQHVTSLEDENLRERALGGPDTTTRLRTRCQVKILPNVGAVSCSDIPALSTLLPPTTARLSTALDDPPAEEPCTLAPGGGYSGLENQLYRVEIHAQANGSPATFKWSRDNGSIVVAATKDTAGNQVEVERLGWDDQRALRQGDWVEVLDDATELRGVPGKIARIVDILPGRIIELDRDVSGYLFGRHARVRRWDQGEEAIDIAAGGATVTIENRIKLTFSGDDYRTGDYWTFAARVGHGESGGLIDLLNGTEPLGIKHHYCKLALITWTAGAGGAVNAAAPTDCRVEFPPLTELPKAATCCTVTVGDGVKSVGDYTDIQDAIDGVEDGGTVCVMPGEYNLDVPLRINGRARITISGCGQAARIRARGPALTAQGSRAIRLQSLYIEAASPGGVVLIGRCEDVAVVGCHVQQVTLAPGTMVAGPALLVGAGRQVRIQSSLLMGNPGVAVSGEDVVIVDNRVLRGGVWVQEGTHMALVAGNRIEGEGARGAGVTLGGMVDVEQPLPEVTGVSAVRIERNLIDGMGGSGISVLSARAGTTTAPGGAAPAPAVTAHRIPPAVGRGRIEDLTIAHNRIQFCVQADASQVATGLGGVVLRDVARVRITDNDITGSGDLKIPCCGVLVHTGAELEIAGNRIVGNGSPSWDGTGSPQAGILAYQVYQEARGAARVHDNVVDCPRGHALFVVAMGQVSIIGNVLASLDIPARPGGPGVLGAAANAGAGVVVWNGGVKSGLLGFQPFWSHVMGMTAVRAVAAAPMQPIAERVLPDGRILFQGNQVTVSGAAPAQRSLRTAVHVVSFDEIGLDANQIDVNVAGMTGLMAMARTLRVSDNRIGDDPEFMSYFGIGKWHIVMGNQGTKCFVARGDHVIETQNQMTFFADPAEAVRFCKDVTGRADIYVRDQGFAIR